MQPVQQETGTRSAQRQSVLVTGATGVLGSAVVRLLRQECAQSESGPQTRVVANYCRNEPAARRLRDETGCEIVQADIAEEAEVEALFSHCGPLYAVVHLAAVARNRLLLRQTHDDWSHTLRVDADGAFLITRAALNNLQNGGRLVLFASRVGERGNAGQSAYAASKAAVIALMKVAAREGAGQGIAVNVVCPGFVPSQSSESLNAARCEMLRKQSVFATFGGSDEVARTVKWLLAPEAAAISGQVIHCDSRI